MSNPIGPDRLPRRGDVIQAAPFFPTGVSGIVVSLSQGRITFDSPVHGRLQLPLARFTWKPQARVWICWPAELAKHMKAVDAAEETHRRARYGLTPCVGDCVSVDGRVGWIVRRSAPVLREPTQGGGLLRASCTYEIALPDGNISVEGDTVAFDSDLRVWCASRN